MNKFSPEIEGRKGTTAQIAKIDWKVKTENTGTENGDPAATDERARSQAAKLFTFSSLFRIFNLNNLLNRTFNCVFCEKYRRNSQRKYWTNNENRRVVNA